MLIGERVFVSGPVHYNGAWNEIKAYGSLVYVGIDACLVNLDVISTELSSPVIVKNKYIIETERECAYEGI